MNIELCSEYALDKVKKHILLTKDEKVIYYYESGNVFYVLSTKRFIKVENKRIVSECNLSDIALINHEYGGPFRWDKLVVTKRDGRIETFGIYLSSIAKEFKFALTKMIESTCTRCGRNNHKVWECYARTTLEGKNIDY